ncbi:MAG: hypothetical protein OIF51_07775 [Cellvibrionaceae bacterium]|nr:hypothetical protein [Cellvibrionaceae bacterium]
MHIFLITAFCLVVAITVLPIGVRSLTEGGKHPNLVRKNVGKTGRVLFGTFLFTIHIAIGYVDGKQTIESWVVSFLVFSYFLYLADCFLTGRRMILPHGAIESGEGRVIRGFIFLFSLMIMAAISFSPGKLKSDMAEINEQTERLVR